jgi:hypothetical protein
MDYLTGTFLAGRSLTSCMMQSLRTVDSIESLKRQPQLFNEWPRRSSARVQSVFVLDPVPLNFNCPS